MLEIRGPRGSGKTRALVALAATDPKAIIIVPTGQQRSHIKGITDRRIFSLERIAKDGLRGMDSNLYLDEVLVSQLPECTVRMPVIAMTGSIWK